MIETLVAGAVQVVGAVVGMIRAAGLSAEAQQKHLDNLFARLNATRALVHAENAETQGIADAIKSERVPDPKPTV